MLIESKLPWPLIAEGSDVKASSVFLVSHTVVCEGEGGVWAGQEHSQRADKKSQIGLWLPV